MHPAGEGGARRGIRWRTMLLACALLSTAACADRMTGVGEAPAATLRLSASVAGTPVATLVAEVTAPDLPVASVFNLPVVDGTASGTLTLAPGKARTITVRAFDAVGSLTHEGSSTADVARGHNPPLTIRLVPQAGRVPITVTMAELSITVTPPAAALEVGETIQLRAVALTAQGDTIHAPVAWATLAPGVATVTAGGVVTGRSAGSAVVVATLAGVAAKADLTVTAP